MSAALLYVSLAVVLPAHTVDLDILATIESNNNARAVSRAGALGLCQIMPATWRQFARPGERWDNPRHSRAVAARYLAWIERTLRRWGDPHWNDTSHILAAYNGGIGRLRRCRFDIRRMPRETRQLVRRYWAKHRERRLRIAADTRRPKHIKKTLGSVKAAARTDRRKPS